MRRPTKFKRGQVVCVDSNHYRKILAIDLDVPPESHCYYTTTTTQDWYELDGWGWTPVERLSKLTTKERG